MKSSRKLVKSLAVLLILFGVSSFVFADYDKEQVVKVMRGNLGFMGAIGEAAEAEDWIVAAQNLFLIAEGMVSILPYTPPRGDKADWDNTMNAFISAAYIGIGAAGARDKDALMEAIGELRQLNRQGHGEHKPPRA